MKKIICITLALLMLLASLSLVACNNDNADDQATLKFGMGVYTNVSKASNAEADVNGQGKYAATVAAVLVDADGKVVACNLDTADITVEYTADGKAIANESFLTKYELGDSYNMKAYGGAAKEWYEQAAAFDAACLGKTAAEIKNLMGSDNKGGADLQTAGCTILVDGFVKAASKIG